MRSVEILSAFTLKTIFDTLPERHQTVGEAAPAEDNVVSLTRHRAEKRVDAWMNETIDAAIAKRMAEEGGKAPETVTEDREPDIGDKVAAMVREAVSDAVKAVRDNIERDAMSYLTQIEDLKRQVSHTATAERKATERCAELEEMNKGMLKENIERLGRIDDLEAMVMTHLNEAKRLQARSDTIGAAIHGEPVKAEPEPEPDADDGGDDEPTDPEPNGGKPNDPPPTGGKPTAHYTEAGPKAPKAMPASMRGRGVKVGELDRSLRRQGSDLSASSLLIRRSVLSKRSGFNRFRGTILAFLRRKRTAGF